MLTPLIIIAVIALIAGGIYFLAENAKFSDNLTQKPWVYSFSLGGYVGAWALFGSIDTAEDSGYLFMSYFFGTSALFLFAPLLLKPLIQLTQTYHLHSLADLLSFRYNSQFAGIIASIGSLFGILPLMVIQVLLIGQLSELIIFKEYIPAYTRHLAVLTLLLGIACITVFNLKTQTNFKKQNQGLVFVNAIFSIVKLILIITVGTYTLIQVFGSLGALEIWLNAQPEKLLQLNQTLQSNHIRSLMLVFFCAALAMPHMFLLTFSERATPAAIKQASWLFPLYLMVLSLPVLPFVWAKEYLAIDVSGQYIPIIIGYLLDTPLLSYLAFTAAVIAVTMSMSTMCIALSGMMSSHLVLPVFLKSKHYRLVDNMLPLQGATIVFILLVVMLMASLSQDLSTLNRFGLASYTALLQFLPSILAVMYWPRANRTGFLASLAAGLSCWFISIVLPLLSEDALGLLPTLLSLFALEPDSYWLLAAVSCLGVNMLTFGFVSILSKTTEEQGYIAKICSQNDIGRPLKRKLLVENIDDIIHNLSREFGRSNAEYAIAIALKELNMQREEKRPFALRLLRRQLESNFSGIYGPTIARRVVASHLPYAESSDSTLEDQQITEYRLEQAKNNLSGLAGELDKMRRQHQQTIEYLPIGVCSLSADREITIWNAALSELTEVHANKAIGNSLERLPEPWLSLFENFIASEEQQLYKQEISFGEQVFWLNLHKGNQESHTVEGNTTILVEDVSSLAKLENDWQHHDRLATIGRLAAGVAHEIGNPITGIACLAQNLKYDSDNPEVDASARDILEQTDRVSKIVQSLVSFSHAGNHKDTLFFEPVNLYQTAQAALELLALKEKDIFQKVENTIPQQLEIVANKQGLFQIFINLIENALQANHLMENNDSNRVIVFISCREFSEYLSIEIKDFGPGIEENLQNTIFEPFFTTKHSDEGTGLGLAIVYNIIEDHQGQIELISPINDQQTGCIFKVQLPLNTGLL